MIFAVCRYRRPSKNSHERVFECMAYVAMSIRTLAGFMENDALPKLQVMRVESEANTPFNFTLHAFSINVYFHLFHGIFFSFFF